MKRLSLVFLAVFVIALLVVSTTSDISAQQRRGGQQQQAAAQQQNTPQRIANRYASGNNPSGVNTAGLPKVAGPLGMIMGPTDEVRDVRGPGFPMAPGTDTYYSTDAVDPIMDPMDWPVDEFISNPDREFDWRGLEKLALRAGRQERQDPGQTPNPGWRVGRFRSGRRGFDRYPGPPEHAIFRSTWSPDRDGRQPDAGFAGFPDHARRAQDQRVDGTGRLLPDLRVAGKFVPQFEDLPLRPPSRTPRYGDRGSA